MTRVLVIDDDAAIRDIMERILANAGYVVSSAEDGRSGLKQFREFHPDLVVTDIIMPDKEGIETIRDLRTQDPMVPIVAVSGGGRVGTLDVLSLAEKFGADQVLSKPFSGGALLNAVRNALAPRRAAPTGSSIGKPKQYQDA